MAIDDEEPLIEPPSAERVLRRAYCLHAIVIRGFAESAEPEEAPFMKDLSQRSYAWLVAHGIASELEEQEHQLLLTPIGKATPKDAINATWRAEGLCVLAWALRAIDMPAHDAQIEPASIGPLVGFLKDLIPTPVLRTSDEIEWLQRRLLGIHWRMRDFSLHNSAVNFAAFAKNNWFGGFDTTDIPIIEGDLSIAGKPVTVASMAEVRSCQSTAQERHQAINWITGDHAIYTEVDTST